MSAEPSGQVEELVRDDGSEITPEHLHEIQAVARLEAERIVQAEWEDPTVDGGD